MQKVGIFDSGLGGLSIVSKVRQCFPQLDICYLGDTARLPYGTKSPETIKSYLKQNIHYLNKQSVDFIIIACNSASSVLSPEDQFEVPVIGVIRSGSEAALRVSNNKKIAVIGTRATISSHAYAKTIYQLNPQSEVYEIACPLFVPLVEEGMIDDPITRLIAYRYLNSLTNTQVDTLVLGCTHYPFLTTAIQSVLGSGIHLVDASMVITEELKNIVKPNPNHNGVLEINCTDSTEHFQKMIDRFLQNHAYEFKKIDL